MFKLVRSFREFRETGIDYALDLDIIAQEEPISRAEAGKLIMSYPIHYPCLVSFFADYNSALERRKVDIKICTRKMAKVLIYPTAPGRFSGPLFSWFKFTSVDEFQRRMLSPENQIPTDAPSTEAIDACRGLPFFASIAKFIHPDNRIWRKIFLLNFATAKRLVYLRKDLAAKKAAATEEDLRKRRKNQLLEAEQLIGSSGANLMGGNALVTTGRGNIATGRIAETTIPRRWFHESATIRSTHET